MEYTRKIHEGTVAEVAISFDKPYTLQELASILYSTFEAQEMPPTPIWYALDTGQERIDEEDFILHGGEVIGFSEHINLLIMKQNDRRQKKMK